MKLIMQLTILATFLASLAQAQMRGMAKPETDALAALNAHRVLKSGMKSKSHKSKSGSSDSGDAEVEGELGCRKECSDKRFTVVCEWEGTHKSGKSKSHKKSRRQLGEAALDFEDEVVEEDSRGLQAMYVGGGRRLNVGLEHVKCVLGVGKEDSDDSSEDYEEFAERVKFPSDDWMLKIKSAEDEKGEIPDYYKFTTNVKFDDLDLDSSSVDELTATLEIELLEVDGALIIDGSDIKFDC